jgi:cytochrome c oxidase subunit III
MADTPRYDLTSGTHHPFHTPAPSVWPLLGSIAAGLLAMFAVLYMHKTPVLGITPGLLGVGLGLVLVLTVMWGWWKGVIREAVVEKAHSPVTRVSFRYGMAMFIASEVMFFVAFFWAFFNSSLFPSAAIGGVWPPKGVESIDPFDLPFLMTMVLLLSGCTVTWAHHAILEGKNKEAVKALAVTVALGVAFTFIQFYEYHHAAFGFKDNVYSSAFYMATGFHGFHVLVGTIFLAVCLGRAMKGHFTKESHFGFEAAAWYWHFVDAVWLFLFAAIYWWGNSGAPH